MRRFVHIIMIMMSLFVVAHVVIPHHHHHDRIYLLAEESHENHEGHSEDENTCHHGSAIAEVLICAAESASQNTTLSPEPIVILLYAAWEGYVFDTSDKNSTEYCSYKDFIPKPPPLLSWSLRAPPSLG